MSISHTTANFTNNLRAKFTDRQISSNVTYTYVQDFKDTVCFHSMLAEHLRPYDGLKARNSKYSIPDIIDFMVDAVFLGYSRFYHMEKLRGDRAYTGIHGKDAPSEKVRRDALALLPNFRRKSGITVSRHYAVRSTAPAV